MPFSFCQCHGCHGCRGQVEPWAKLKKTRSEEDKKTALCELLVMAEGVLGCCFRFAAPFPAPARCTDLCDAAVARDASVKSEDLGGVRPL